MSNGLKDGVDFMHDCIEKPALYGRFLDKFYSEPQPTNQELSEWFGNEGYEVDPAKCTKIRTLMTMTERTPPLHY